VKEKKWASKVNLSETKNGHLGALSEIFDGRRTIEVHI